MAVFRWIKTFLFLILLLQFSAVTGQYTSLIVRDGKDVTLPCNSVTDNHGKCGSTTWTSQGSSGQIELIIFGKISENAKSKSDRLSVTKNCSLVIKKVTADDAGRYSCQQSKAGTNDIYLFVVNMTEHKDTDKVNLSCSVSTYEECRHTVKWLYEEKDVKENKWIRHFTSQSHCSASVGFLTSGIDMSKWGLFKCEVTDERGKHLQFSFSPQSSGEGAKEATTKPTAVKPTTKSIISTKATPTTKATPAGWWGLIILPVVLAALIVALVRWKRAKGSKTQVDTSTPDPEDGVSYTSISYTRTTNRKAQVQGNDGNDDDDAVTYTTVKVPSPSTGDYEAESMRLKHDFPG